MKLRNLLGVQTAFCVDFKCGKKAYRHYRYIMYGMRNERESDIPRCISHCYLYSSGPVCLGCGNMIFQDKLFGIHISYATLQQYRDDKIHAKAPLSDVSHVSCHRLIKAYCGHQLLKLEIYNHKHVCHL